MIRSGAMYLKDWRWAVSPNANPRFFDLSEHSVQELWVIPGAYILPFRRLTFNFNCELPRSITASLTEKDFQQELVLTIKRAT